MYLVCVVKNNKKIRYTFQSAQDSNSCSTNGSSLGRGFVFDWPMTFQESCLIGDSIGAEITLFI